MKMVPSRNQFWFVNSKTMREYDEPDFKSSCQSAWSAETAAINILWTFDEQRLWTNKRLTPNNRSKLKPSNAKCPQLYWLWKVFQCQHEAGGLYGRTDEKCLKVMNLDCTARWTPARCDSVPANMDSLSSHWHWTLLPTISLQKLKLSASSRIFKCSSLLLQISKTWYLCHSKTVLGEA